MRKTWLVLSVVVLVAATATSARPARERVVVDGVVRKYRVATPPAGSGSRLPVVVAFHGGGGDGASMERFSGLDELARSSGVLVVYPDGTGRLRRVLTWNAGTCCASAARDDVDDVRFVGALIDDLVARHNADPERVYLTGMSNGAMMAYRVAAELPHRIAAVGAVAGGLEVPPSSLRGAVPILHVHGTEDEHVPFEGGRGRRSIAGVPFTSVEATIRAWVARNDANPVPVVERLPDTVDDGTRIVRKRYAARPGGAEVVLYVVEGGGHTWPGGRVAPRLLGVTSMDVSARDLLWDFFRDKRAGR